MIIIVKAFVSSQLLQVGKKIVKNFAFYKTKWTYFMEKLIKFLIMALEYSNLLKNNLFAFFCLYVMLLPLCGTLI